MPRSICRAVFYPFTEGAVQHATRRSGVRQPAEPTGEDAVDGPKWDTALVPGPPRLRLEVLHQRLNFRVLDRIGKGHRMAALGTRLTKRICKLLIPAATARALLEQIYQALVGCLRQREMDF